MKEDNQLRHLERILQSYHGEEPFNLYLKKQFREHKNFGSKDRRFYSSESYAYLRFHKLFTEKDLLKRLALSLFMSHNLPTPFLLFIGAKAGYDFINDESVMLSFAEKYELVKSKEIDISVQHIFPAIKNLSEDIKHAAFVRSHFEQPLAWLRVKRSKADEFEEKLKASGMRYEKVGRTAFGFKQGTDLSTLEKDSYYFEMQDLSSQLTGNFIHVNAGEVVWDCCAASGGKSLMMLDSQHDIHLYVSDVRETMLLNLNERFSKAGAKKYAAAAIDLLHDKTFVFKGQTIPHNFFDTIIFDAPCTGSGTWGRTPEMLTYFDTEKINTFAKLQLEMAKKIAPYLKPGGQLIYITCSVYKEENEDNLQIISQQTGLTIERQELIKGYESKADSMFVGVLRKAGGSNSMM